MNKLIQGLTLAQAGLEAVGRLSDDAEVILGRSPTQDQLRTVVSTLIAIVASVRNGLSGGGAHENALIELNQLNASIADNNAGADAALDAKFPSDK